MEIGEGLLFSCGRIKLGIWTMDTVVTVEKALYKYPTRTSTMQDNAWIKIKSIHAFIIKSQTE
jgi:hypothetical protein